MYVKESTKAETSLALQKTQLNPDCIKKVQASLLIMDIDNNNGVWKW